MEIKDFQHVRVGSGFPASFDIEPIEGHESHGVYAISNLPWIPDRKNEGGYAQFRQLKDGTVALFAFRFGDMKVPAFWDTSRVLWDSRKKEEDA